MAAGIHDASSVGRKVLPATFNGGPRFFQQLLQDAMAIVRHYGKPTAFVTMTCNPKWPEITAELLPGQDAFDRPDLCARVFRMYLDELLKDLTKRQFLGKVVAHIYVIEFQKRGLPHAHILLILDSEDKPHTPTDVDRMTSAEIPDPITQPLAYETVCRCMMHGPCGVLNPRARCMEGNPPTCSKHYPKQFRVETTMGEFKPEYRRHALL